MRSYNYIHPVDRALTSYGNHWSQETHCSFHGACKEDDWIQMNLSQTFLREGRVDRQSKSWPRDQKLRRGGEGGLGSSSAPGHGTCRSSFKVARGGRFKSSDCRGDWLLGLEKERPGTGNLSCMVCWDECALLWSLTASCSLLSCRSCHRNAVICISSSKTSTSNIAISNRSFCSCNNKLSRPKNNSGRRWWSLHGWYTNPSCDFFIKKLEEQDEHPWGCQSGEIASQHLSNEEDLEGEMRITIAGRCEGMRFGSTPGSCTRAFSRAVCNSCSCSNCLCKADTCIDNPFVHLWENLQWSKIVIASITEAASVWEEGHHCQFFVDSCKPQKPGLSSCPFRNTTTHPKKRKEKNSRSLRMRGLTSSSSSERSKNRWSEILLLES